jgi:tRNA 2-thiouridine synthesizing protein A
MKHDVILDVSGQRCPRPILEARKKLNVMLDGQVLKVIATDPLAQMDFEIFCKNKSYTLIESYKDVLQFIFYIKK